MEKMNEAIFINTSGSANPSTFKNMGKTEKDAEYINEWVAYNIEHKDNKLQESIDDEAENPVQAFLISVGFNPDSHTEDEVTICDGEDNYHAETPFGDRVHNKVLLDFIQEDYADVKEALEKRGVDYCFDWDELIATSEVNGEIIYGDFTFHGKRYFGFGCFH